VTSRKEIFSPRAGIVTVALAAVGLALTAPAGAAGATLTVKAVPALQGLDFRFGGHRYTTSKDGIVTIPVAAPGAYRLVALPWRHENRGIRVTFSRWADDSFTPGRTITVNGSRSVEVGYGVSYRRGVTFYDCVKAEKADRDTGTRTGCERDDVRRVPPKRVTSVTLANSIGSKFVFKHGKRKFKRKFKAKWLEGVRVSRRLNGLEETLITYSVMQVMVGGSDVVNQAQQRFYLAEPDKGKKPPRGHLSLVTKDFPIRLSLYDAFFSTHDLLFRGPVGHALQITYPDGRQREVTLRDGKRWLRSMPRGLYHVKVKTSAGIPMTVPVSLSKNQRMQLKVISYADVLGSFAVFALVSIVLVTARRPALRAAIRRRISKLGRNWRRAVEVRR
jgi:hypothetical protein